MDELKLRSFLQKFGELEARRMSGSPLSDKEALLLNHLRGVLQQNKKALDQYKNESESHPFSEQIKKPLLPTELRMDFKTFDDFMRVYSKNVVGGGVCLEMERSLPLGHKIQLNINIKENKLSLDSLCEVVLTNKSKNKAKDKKIFTLKFVEIDEEIRKMFEERSKVYEPGDLEQKELALTLQKRARQSIQRRMSPLPIKRMPPPHISWVQKIKNLLFSRSAETSM